MPDWSVVNRSHVLAAIDEHDRLGAKEFLRRYGFGRARTYVLWHNGQEYASKAVLGVAYLRASGGPAGSEDFSGGEAGAAKVLREMGFDVVAEEEPVTPRSRRAPAKKSTRTRSEPAAPTICPHCYMAIPATGICDNCG
jgi:hypothetical protein